MTESNRPAPDAAAVSFVAERFPDCLVAIVGGSWRSGDTTATSDLDVVIVTDDDEAPFRASYVHADWPVEAFVHSPASLRVWLARDAERFRPSLLTMCAEGIVLRDVGGLAGGIQAEAREMLARGPEPLTPEERDWRRYAVTDALDDFLGCDRIAEGVLIAAALSEAAAALLLLENGRWIGTGKWTLRALRRWDDAVAARLATALEAYARHGEKEPLVRFVEDALAPSGGRLFDGFYASGKG